MSKPNHDQNSPDNDTKPRKERVLHTRVPEVLDQELKRLAETLRVPVSNVVRTILTDAVEAANAVGKRAEGELRGVADRLHDQRARLHAQTRDRIAAGMPLPDPNQRSAPTQPPQPARPTPPLAGVIGFQPMLLARATVCSVCGEPLNAGGQAFFGITDQPGTGPIVGRECLPFSHQPADSGEGAPK